MAMIQKICPVCGGTAQIEETARAVCPYCAAAFPAEFPQEPAADYPQQYPADAGGMQMQQMPVSNILQKQAPEPQNMQYQQNPQYQQNQQYQQNPQYQQNQQYQQTPQYQQNPQFQQNPQYPQNPQFQQYPQYPQSAQYQPYPQNPQFRQNLSPGAAYSPEQIQDAQKKRTSWHLMNAAMFGMQCLILALGIYWDDWGYDMGMPVVMGWLTSLPLCAVVSSLMRPDQAYLEKKPMFSSRWLYGIMHGVIHLVGSGVLSGILYALLDSLF